MLTLQSTPFPLGSPMYNLSGKNHSNLFVPITWSQFEYFVMAY